MIEAVGTQQSMAQAIGATRPGGHVGYVGVSHGVTLDGQKLFFSHVYLHGGPAPVPYSNCDIPPCFRDFRPMVDLGILQP